MATGVKRSNMVVISFNWSVDCGFQKRVVVPGAQTDHPDLSRSFAWESGFTASVTAGIAPSGFGAG
jgi:hypothetical protein